MRRPDSDGEVRSVMRSSYTLLGPTGIAKPAVTASDPKLRRRDTIAPSSVKEDEFVKLSMSVTVTALLVAVHTCLSRDDWMMLLPHLWQLIGNGGRANGVIKPVSYCEAGRRAAYVQAIFLLMKCGEMIPNDLHDLVLSELYR